MKYLGVIFLFLIFCGCSSLTKDNNCKSIFTESEIKTQKRIVHFMDSIVLANTNESDIESSYIKFCKNEIIKIDQTGEAILLLMNYPDIELFLRSLNSEHLKEYFLIRDTMNIKVRAYEDSIYIKSFKDSLVYNAFDKDLEFNGKYMQLLSCLSKENEYLASHIDDLYAAGGFGPNFSETLFNIDKFNLKNESERLVIAINLFSVNKGYWEY